MSERRGARVILLALIVSFLIVPSVFADPQYNRERSEALFHLIDWRDYSPETFEDAIAEQKPIFLMISAPAWCYWCHVYESEDYLYHPELYPYINEHFIPIFVDSDKRPDLTRKYLEGGWPSTTIFTPNLRRIQGFSGPREPLGLRQYLGSVVEYLSDKSFTESHLQISYEKETPVLPTARAMLIVEDQFLAFTKDRYDPVYGGIGLGDLPEWREGQKFPKQLTYSFLLERYARIQKQDSSLLDMVKFTFDNQFTRLDELETRYRLYDPVEGGFHRYTTKRNWSIPHYEKMLYDQAKYLPALSRLYSITGDADVKTALDGTVDFILMKLYDPDGGFYTSQDAHLEEHYYGLGVEGREEEHQPFVDKMRRTDQNGMMIVGLITSDVGKDVEIRDSLDFLRDTLVGDNGAFTYVDYGADTAELTGLASPNAWAILAFVEGYAAYGDKSYLQTADALATYSIENLYDIYGGGFFERNSEDSEYYAPNERVSLDKRYDENAVLAYAMLRLYLISDDMLQLEVGMRTLGTLLEMANGMDETYYMIKSSWLVQEHKLIRAYSQQSDEIETTVSRLQKNHWIDSLLSSVDETQPLADVPTMKNEFVDASFVILLIVAFLAGLLSFLSPCTLPVLTAYFAQSMQAKKGKILKETLSFFLGLALVFSIFGMGATFIGTLLRDHRLIFTQIAGAVIITFGILEIMGRGFTGIHVRLRGKHDTPLGAFIFGAIFAVGWSACIGPILASLLLLSATSGTILQGMILLFVYAIGLTLPLVFISLYFDRIKNKKFWKIIRGKEIRTRIFGRRVRFHTTYLVTGLLLILIGSLIATDMLFKLNQLAVQSGYVQEIIVRGEEFLQRLLR